MSADERRSRDPKRPLCFAIGPYGADDSTTRKWSDFLFAKVIEPVLKNDYVVQRTIDDPEPGKISDRIERDLNEARLVVADLTDSNPNLYFELGYRHALGRPVIHLARAGTILPFDIQDFEVIWIHADYFEKRGFFAISDDELMEACNELRAQVDRVASLRRPPKREPVSAKVYRWEMWYSSSIATDWLDKQDEAFRSEIKCYEGGGGSAAVSDKSLPFFAEYLALKGAASQGGEGTIFLTLNNHTEKLDLGYAVFRFSNVAAPVLIEVVDVAYSSDGLSSIRFVQQSRPFQVQRGSGNVDVTIPGFKYTLRLEHEAKTDSESVCGTIDHPRSKTLIGRAEVSSKYGCFFS